MKLLFLLTACIVVSAFGNDADIIAIGTPCSFFANSDVCNNYFMDFHEKLSCGWGRQKVLCRKVTRGTWIRDTDENTLRIVSYNVRELPHLFFRKGERERTCRIPNAINRQFDDADVVVFQELFDKGCLRNQVDMARLLRTYGYLYSYQPLEDEVKFPKFVGAGVMVASKWPIVKSDSKIYKATVKSTSDFLSRKGALYVSVKKGEKIYHIFGTHLQATYSSKAKSVRLEQAKELKSFKDEMAVPNDEPVIYAGDFNEDYWTERDHTTRIIQALDAKMANITGNLRYTYDRANMLTADGDPSGWLDYFLVSKSNRQPKKAVMRAFDLAHYESFKYCSFALNLLHYVTPDSKFCFKTKSTRTLSDHYPLYGIFEFE